MEKRSIVIPLRLNAGELKQLNRQAENAGLSREEFLRSLILGAELRPRPCTHHADLLRKLAGFCNNANQLAKKANTCGLANQQNVDEMVRIARKIWELVKEQW